MKATTILSVLPVLAAGVLCAAPASKSAPSADVLKSDKERDSFAIAEQLYRQGNVEGLDDTARRNILSRVSTLLKNFVEEFPNSANKTKALYLRATCEEKLGRKDILREVLTELAAVKSESKDEFIAAAAYKLGTTAFANGSNNVADSASLLQASRYFETVQQYSSNTVLVYDSLYRRARALTLMGQRRADKSSKAYTDEAVSLYNRFFKTPSPDVPEHIQGPAHYAYAQLLVEVGGDDNLQTALDQFKLFLQDKNTNEHQRSIAILQSARIASKLNKPDESAKYYEDLIALPGMKDYKGEANMEIILALYRANRYEEIRNRFSQDAKDATFLQEIKIPLTRALCAGILGHVYMIDSQYAKAAGYFMIAEEDARMTPRGADSGYRLIVCIQQLTKSSTDKGAIPKGLPSLDDYCRTYLKMYDSDESPETKGMQCTDLVRAIYADHLMTIPGTLPWEQYLSIDMANLPEYLLEDTAYKKAWCLFRVWSENHESDKSPENALNYYIDKLQNQRRLANVLFMRGNYYYDSKRYENAIIDFTRVIEQYPDSPSYPACMLRAAYACMNCQPQRTDEAKKYFGDLLAYASRFKEQDEKDAHNISVYAESEAYFNLGCLCYADEPEKSIEYFKQAIKSNSNDYAASASANLIKCYIKLKDSRKADLLEALPILKATYPSQYQRLSRDIPKWCGLTWYREAKNSEADISANYRLAVEYLNDAVDRKKTESYTDAAGEQKQRPVAEPAVWLTLARACLEIEFYRSTDSLIGGLEAIDYYLSMETDPHRRADGLKTKAMLLNGANEPAAATELCTEALNLGVNGPVLSSIRLVAGDSAYIQGDYERASQLYGLVANFDRNNDLNREALYKAARALRKNGKEAEAANYEARLAKKLEEMNLNIDAPLSGLPPSVGRHVSK